MTPATLLALADRVEALKGPCRETDSAVDIAAFSDRHSLADLARGQMSSWWAMLNNIPRYTASLDAAMTLVPEGWDKNRKTLLFWRRSFLDGRVSCGLSYSFEAALYPKRFDATCATEPLALTAAALRARAMMETDHG